MKAWPWQIATAVLATLIILYAFGIFDGTPIDLARYNQLKTEVELQKNENRRIQDQHEIERAELQTRNDSLEILITKKENEKIEITRNLGNRLRIIRDEPLDTVAIILTSEAPPGY